jgi:arsenite methyltransferase
MAAIRPYESPELREVTGPTLRPGGFTLTDRATDICNLSPGAAVLDIGCGLGATVNRLKTNYGFNAFGLDVSISLLREGRSISSSAALIAGLAERLPVREKILDAVFCECVLSLLDDPARSLAQFAQVLRPWGWLVIADIYARRPEGASNLKRLALKSCLQGARPRREIMGLVEAAGFEAHLWEDHSDLLKQLAGRLVFAYGSMREFWAAFAPNCNAPELACGLEQARPGYYLMAARKKPKAQD